MKFKQITTEKKNGWTKWENPVMTNYQMACCDCGLVHTINFQVVEVVKVTKTGLKTVMNLPKKKYQVLMKARRNIKYTKQLRNKKPPKGS